MRARRAHRQRGMTIIEVLLVIVIIGIFLGIAGPSFRSFTAGQRVKTVSFDFYATLVFARSEAIKRRQPVTIAPVSPNDWTTGWTVTVGSTALRTQDALTGVSMSGAPSVVYRQDGRLTSASAIGVLIQPATADATIANRCIRVDLTGLPKSTSTSGTTCP